VLDIDLWNVVANGPAEQLNSTDITQPAMLAAGFAIWSLWKEHHGESPEIMAGHSLGEYTALVCADVIEFEQAISLVAARGRYMQAAVPTGTGAMAAILGLSDDEVKNVCLQASDTGIVEAVNFNSPGQVVIAGESDAVQNATELAKQAGAKRAIILPVSVPSHCQLMKPAADKLAIDLQALTFTTPTIPVLNNVDVLAVSEPDEIKQALIKQLYHPVRWVETIESIAEKGVDSIIECGPGKVLLGLNKRINKSLAHKALCDAENFAAQLQNS
jgi:[acyl-carrier-protein] S-malonyltransferase